jgi:phosphate transport system ATP-binding protein
MMELRKPQVAVRAPTGPAASETAIQVAGVDVWYGPTHSVHGIDMAIPARRVTAFIGPSGCGKSTLLRCFNRMNDLIPDCRVGGEIRIHGRDIQAPGTPLEELRRQVGMVFQRSNPFSKTIYDNVAYGPRVHGQKDRAALDRIVESCLTRVALWDEVKDRLRSSALELSGGQQQRLCIARALAVEPVILLMDEPASALDPRATGRIEDLITELRDHYTIVIVTHNMQQAARVSDHTAFLYEGRLVEFNETERLFTKPDHEQTNDYITGRFG